MNVDGLVDAAARRAIREALDRTLVVEAAAGTGKTTELVQRIVAIVESGRGSLSSIVAVTFTEKAAGEMKLRIRTELDRALSQASRPEGARDRLRAALSELETAKIGTIHALCADLLRVHPVEAGVDPAFEVLDAARARTLLERAFDRWFERVVDAPPEGVRRVLARKQVNERSRSARELLFSAVANLVETRDFSAPYRRDPLAREQAIADALARLQSLADLARLGSASDPLRRGLASLGEKLSRARHLELDAQEEFLRMLARDKGDRSELYGRKGRGEHFGGELSRAEVLARRAEAASMLEELTMRLGADLAACLSRELLPVVQAYQAEKARLGALDFFDLLLSARRLIVEAPAVRRALKARLTHLFVDEFQDTDPVQAEILLLLAAEGDEADPWRVRPAPGKLFVVGDPKQSIYRFRRADVQLYERVKRHLLSHGAELVQLSTSFRSLPGIQSCVNAAFEPLMAGDAARGQASYVPLSPFRASRASQPEVIALPAPKPYGPSGRITKTALNACLPDTVAAFVDWLLRKSGYRVEEGGREVPLEARHVCLLFRRFRSFDDDATREYVRALEARRIPHVLSGGRSFHAREEVIALRAVLTAIEWPDDALHVYAVLRGPFVAFSDEVLWSFKRTVGHLHPLRAVEVEALDPKLREVAEVLALLAKLHRGRNHRPIASTLLAWLDALRAHAGIAIWPTGEQALGNVLRVLDLARAHERSRRVTSFRGFVEWLDRQAELAEAPEAPVIEEGSDGVRIMTVHAAKGLEFPVVVLCDPTAPKRPQHASRYIDPERRLWAQPLCEVEPIELVEHREQVRDHDESEVIRLTYVAATRAKELLVVPTCGDAVIDGWLDVLAPALYPHEDCCRKPLASGAGCPPFGGDTVTAWPQEADRDPERSVAPGEHLPQRGAHRVVWWDPHVLELDRPPVGGLTQQELLRADEGGRDERGLAQYTAWREARAQTRERATEPSWRVMSMTQAAHAEAASAERSALEATGGVAVQGMPGGVAAELEILDSGAERHTRPSGPRFGSLVHALLERAPSDAAPAALEQLASYLGRSLGASAPEIARAAADVQRALAHPLFERVRAAEARGEVYRELPVSVRSSDGLLLEGVVDLAFVERDGGTERLCVVDYKTDVELGALEGYARQLAMYCAALGQAWGLATRAVLLRV